MVIRTTDINRTHNITEMHDITVTYYTLTKYTNIGATKTVTIKYDGSGNISAKLDINCL